MVVDAYKTRYLLRKKYTDIFLENPQLPLRFSTAKHIPKWTLFKTPWAKQSFAFLL